MGKKENSNNLLTDQSKHTRLFNIEQVKKENPCENCEAPCCKLLLIPLQPPKNFMDLDHVSYMLGFHGINVVLYQDGSWQVLVKQNCSFLDEKINKCQLHNSQQKPKTCVFFNPYNCFYKRNFSDENPESIIKINKQAFDKVLGNIKFNELGDIISIPPQEQIKSIVNEISHQE